MKTIETKNCDYCPLVQKSLIRGQGVDFFDYTCGLNKNCEYNTEELFKTCPLKEQPVLVKLSS